MSYFRNFMFGIVIISIIILFGTLGFSYIEGYNLLDSFYWVILNITTVGSSIVLTNDITKIISIIVIISGVGIVFYSLTLMAKMVISGEIRFMFSSIKGGIINMKKQKKHVIICGYSKLGKYVCETLRENNQKYVIIEKDIEKCKKLLENGEYVLQGNALDQDILKKAGIKDAKALVATLSNDANNLYLIMTAKEINSDIIFSGEATSEEAVKRLHSVGSQIVVFPEVVGGKQLANSILRLEEAEKLETISKE